jgi:hypothetical protein
MNCLMNFVEHGSSPRLIFAMATIRSACIRKILKNSLPYASRTLRVHGHAIRTHESVGFLSSIDEQYPA